MKSTAASIATISILAIATLQQGCTRTQAIYIPQMDKCHYMPITTNGITYSGWYVPSHIMYKLLKDSE